MKKMKILLIGMTTNIGGIETLLYNIATNLDKTKFEIYSLDSCRLNTFFPLIFFIS